MDKVSIQDIARSLKISKSTVSLVLNGRGDDNRISKETQVRITDYARSVKYLPNSLARGLSRGKSETIGLIVPDIANHFYARVAHRVEVKANSYGYQVLYSSSLEQPDLESRLIGTMLHRQVDGLIIASTQQNHGAIIQLQKSNFPLVLLDRHYPEIDTNYVIVENANGVQRAVHHMVSMGRRSIAFVNIRSGLEAMSQRLIGFRKGLKDAGLPVRDEWICAVDNQEAHDQLDDVIQHLLSSSRGVDAIIFATHYLATKGLRTLRKLEIKIPEEVAMLSFDDIDAFDLVEPPITSITQPVDELGDKAMDILWDHMNGSLNAFQQVVLPTTLTIRSSCGEKQKVFDSSIHERPING